MVGMGIIASKNMNNAIFFKWLWKFANVIPSLWVKVIQDYYFMRGRSWNKGRAHSSFTSPIWKDVLRQTSSFCEHTEVVLGDNKDCLFWKDAWNSPEPLTVSFLAWYDTTKNPKLSLHRAVVLLMVKGW